MDIKKLLSDRVLILEEEEKTENGIIISRSDDQEIDSYKTGVVVSVGPGKKNHKGELIPIEVSVNDKVLFQFGKKVRILGKTYILVREEDIALIF